MDTPCVSEPQCERPYSAYCDQLSHGWDQTDRAHLADTFETLCRGDVPLAALGDLGEDPRLDERPPSDHNPVNAARFLLLVVTLGVSWSWDVDRGS